MNDELSVVDGDRVVARLTRLRGGDLRLTYSDSYRAIAHPTPISVSLPVSTTAHRGPRLSNWLWGLLPDNEAVLRTWARTFSVSLASPFGLLSTPIGRDCAGAFSFVRDPIDVERNDGATDWLTEAQVAAALRGLRADSTSWLGSDPPGRFSLAGVQPKTALQRDGDRWGRPSGATATTHILKPAILGLDDHDLNEHLCLRAAHAAGLLVVNTTIESFEDQSAIVVQRYDRMQADGQQIRIHQEDLCQAHALHPGVKYQADGGPSPASIAELLRRVMPSRTAEDAVERFGDALLWNWIIAGTDAHAKNYSLLLSGDAVRLAPLYDISSALPYESMPVKKLRLAMKLGRGYELDARPSTWPILARSLGVSPDALTERARNLAVHAPDAFADAVADPSVAPLSSSLPNRLLDAVAVRARQCLTALDGRGSVLS